MTATISVLIDLPTEQAYHAAMLTALDHAIVAGDRPVDVRVVPTATIDDALIADPGDGVVVGPGSPYDEPERVLEVILGARERGVPLVGT
ncbi:MAG: hypothetical protein AAGA93_06060 [Actinomycetota bacterium]